jgi:GT2 family glycosyltransferase
MFEDDDYSLRVSQAGLRIVSAEDCFVHHFGGGSFNRLDRERLDAIFRENRSLFEDKWKLAWHQGPMRQGVAPIESARKYELATFFLKQERPH